MGSFTDYQSIYKAYFNLFSHASVWLNIILTIVTSIIPDFVLKVFENLFDQLKIKKIKLHELEELHETKSTINDLTPVRLFILPSNINSNRSSIKMESKRNLANTKVIKTDLSSL